MNSATEQGLVARWLPKLPRFSGESGAVEWVVKEVQTFLEVQPMASGVTVPWILGALEGRARHEILDRPNDTINTAEKILAVLLYTFGDQRDEIILAAAFYRRLQGMGEAVEDYASSMRQLFTLENKAKPGILAEDTLRDAFVQGLQPAALRRDMRAYCRTHSGLTLEAIRKEAQRWMREDFLEVSSAKVSAAAPTAQVFAAAPTEQILTHLADQVVHLEQRMAYLAEMCLAPRQLVTDESRAAISTPISTGESTAALPKIPSSQEQCVPMV